MGIAGELLAFKLCCVLKRQWAGRAAPALSVPVDFAAARAGGWRSGGSRAQAWGGDSYRLPRGDEQAGDRIDLDAHCLVRRTRPPYPVRPMSRWAAQAHFSGSNITCPPTTCVTNMPNSSYYLCFNSVLARRSVFCTY